MVEARLHAAPLQFGVDLRTRPMHQHQTDAEGGEQVAVLGQRLGEAAHRHLAAEADDEGAPAEGVHIGRGGPHPVDEAARGFVLVGDLPVVVHVVPDGDPYAGQSGHSQPIACSMRSHRVRSTLMRA
ncbi:MAG: hypothetical protein H6R11_1524 [Proteobacteria bacterium]|nr:hypothetical protein [Pseudomonadota bacterium]